MPAGREGKPGSLFKKPDALSSLGFYRVEQGLGALDVTRRSLGGDDRPAQLGRQTHGLVGREWEGSARTTEGQGRRVCGAGPQYRSKRGGDVGSGRQGKNSCPDRTGVSISIEV